MCVFVLIFFVDYISVLIPLGWTLINPSYMRVLGDWLILIWKKFPLDPILKRVGVKSGRILEPREKMGKGKIILGDIGIYISSSKTKKKPKVNMDLLLENEEENDKTGDKDERVEKEKVDMETKF